MYSADHKSTHKSSNDLCNSHNQAAYVLSQNFWLVFLMFDRSFINYLCLSLFITLLGRCVKSSHEKATSSNLHTNLLKKYRKRQDWETLQRKQQATTIILYTTYQISNASLSEQFDNSTDLSSSSTDFNMSFSCFWSLARFSICRSSSSVMRACSFNTRSTISTSFRVERPSDERSAVQRTSRWVAYKRG